MGVLSFKPALRILFRATICSGLAGLSVASAAGAPSGNPIDFDTEVMAVFSKAGCNMGACHGNANGKGDLKLTLRGERAGVDFKTLTETKDSGWINLENPENSLILKKPTLQVDHEGKERFKIGSPEYQVLLDWIRSGAKAGGEEAPDLVGLKVTPESEVVFAPIEELPLKVEATFSDGSVRDVTRWACYEASNLKTEVSYEGIAKKVQVGETTVTARYLHLQKPVRLAFMPNRDDFVWQEPGGNNYIDEQVFGKLRELNTNPSPLAVDAVFMRRVSLDIAGVIPDAAAARAFVADKDPDKRRKLIDRLLQSGEFADFWALKWSDLLRNEEKTIDKTGVDKFHVWIRESIASGKPLDQFARELVTGEGSTYKNPPSNYYRALRKPVDRAEATAQVFLGTRLRCAQCHNHPFDRWTQDEYYQFAALFDGIDYKIIENKRRDKFDKNQFIGEQIVLTNEKKEFKDPRTKKAPKMGLLGSESPAIREEKRRLHELADWMTSEKNTLFARVQVNRVWFHMFGRGLVDPVDDFRSTNPASHPALLDVLAADFAAHRFDLRHVIRTIANSRAYQLSSVPMPSNKEDESNYSHSTVSRLTAEQLLDAISKVAEVPVKFREYDEGTRAMQLSGVQRSSKSYHGDEFLKMFGKPQRLISSDLERSNTTSLAQVFMLTSGRGIDEILQQSGNRIERLLKSGRDDLEILDELFWVALTRPPGERELKEIGAYLSRAPDRRRALEDVLWGLMNAKEFLLRR